jgi:hypothetical protein
MYGGSVMLTLSYIISQYLGGPQLFIHSTDGFDSTTMEEEM